MIPSGEPGAGEALRFAARVVGDPACAIGHWRAVTGGKAAACLPFLQVPEILHAAGILPVQWRDPGISKISNRVLPRIDAWVVDPGGLPFPPFEADRPRFDFPASPPAGLPDALDLLESLAEWAGAVSGRPVTEGALWKSILVYGERNVLLRFLEERVPPGAGSLHPGEAAILVRAGDFLPPETHRLLMARFLPANRQGAPFPREEERGDPLLALSRRVTANHPAE